MSLRLSHDSGLSVIIVDDNPEHRELLSLALEETAESELHCDSLSIHQFGDPMDALASLPPRGDIVIIFDYHLAGTNGLEWLEDFTQEHVGPIIFTSGSGNEEIVAEAFRGGASDYLIKDNVFRDARILGRAIREAMRKFKLEDRSSDLRRQLKLANEELERKNEALADLTETAHRFVDDVAHEFRTPLAVIKEFASILTDGLAGETNDKQKDYLAFISDAARDLASLVDDFLDSGKLRARTLRVERQSHSISDIVNRALPLVKARAASKHLQIVINAPDDLGAVLCDLDKVCRIILNIAINAIKFSPGGSEVELWARGHGSEGVELGVTDHGPGMTEEDVGRLFQRFRQVGDVRQTNSKGFGLGLCIAQELTSLNLGQMSVTSSPGHGSTFSFTLPPADHEAALSWYFDCVNSDDNAHPISLLHATCTGRGGSIDHLLSSLASTCYPMDFLIPSTSGVYLIGVTDAPDKWRDRLAAVHAEQTNLLPDSAIDTLNIKSIGSWSSPQAQKPIIAHVFGRAKEERRCA